MFNPQTIMSQLSKMFPNNQNDIQNAINQANKAIQGATDNQAGDIARNFGITEQGINDIYNKYGNNPMAKTILQIMGTSPDKLKNEALNIVNMKGSNNTSSNANSKFKSLNSNNSNSNKSSSNGKFPRLK